MIIKLLELGAYMLAGLLVFMIIYDHCVYRKPFKDSVRDRALLFFLSPFSFLIYRAIAFIAIFYLIYALMHNGSLF